MTGWKVACPPCGTGRKVAWADTSAWVSRGASRVPPWMRPAAGAERNRPGLARKPLSETTRSAWKAAASPSPWARGSPGPPAWAARLFESLGPVTPVLAGVRPVGEHVIETFEAAGGLQMDALDKLGGAAVGNIRGPEIAEALSRNLLDGVLMDLSLIHI